jgi:hypothetical protein
LREPVEVSFSLDEFRVLQEVNTAFVEDILQGIEVFERFVGSSFTNEGHNGLSRREFRASRLCCAKEALPSDLP